MNDPIAITYSRYGGPDVLTVSDVAAPEPGPGQVRVRVRAAGINLIDLKLRRGELAKFFTAHFPVTPGFDVAGTVDALGENVTGTEVGDDVLGVTDGSYATYALLNAPVSKPASLPWEFAASLPVVGEAAFRVLEHLAIRAGDTLLVHGAAGSVGSLATQLAISRGATVIGVAGEDDLAYVRSLGASAVVRGDGLAERVRAISPRGADAALDTVGHGLLPVSIELAGGPERVVTIADATASQYGVRFTGSDPNDRFPAALPWLVSLAVADKLKLRVGTPYRLVEAAAAHTAIETGTYKGKGVLVA